MKYFGYIDVILLHDIGLNRSSIIVYFDFEDLFHLTIFTNTADESLHIVRIVGVFHSLVEFLLVFRYILLEVAYLDKLSMCCIFSPFLYSTLNWYCCRLRIHLARRPFGNSVFWKFRKAS